MSCDDGSVGGLILALALILFVYGHTCTGEMNHG